MSNKLFTIILLLSLAVGCKTTYQLGQCEDLFLDLEKGKLNGISPIATMDEVKLAFPCFTGETEEGANINCGGGLFFLDHDFYFYTHADYIEVRGKYKGKISKPVLNLNRASFVMMYGNPDNTLEHEDELMGTISYYHQYDKKWGTLTFVEEEGKISELKMYQGKKIGEIDYCF